MKNTTKWFRALYLLSTSVIILNIVACKEDDLISQNSPLNKTEYSHYSMQDRVYKGLTYFSPSLSDGEIGQLTKICPEKGNISDASMAIFSSQEALGIEDKINAILSQNRIVAVVDPTFDDLNKLSTLYNISIPECEEQKKIYILAFSLNSSYTLCSTDISSDIPYLNFVRWLNRKSANMIFKSSEVDITPYNVSIDFTQNLLGTISFNYDILPIYVNQSSLQNKSGDYYMIKGNMTLLPVQDRPTSYPWSMLKIDYSLVNDKEEKINNVEFPVGMSPHPTTMTSGVTYESSFDFNFNGAFTAGPAYSKAGWTPVGIVIPNFDFRWPHTETHTLQDVEGELSTQMGEVKYTYYCNNGSQSSINNVSLYNSWVWHIPSGEVNDNDTKSFKLDLKMEVTYTTGNVCSTHQTIKLCHPDRQRYGLLKFPNFSKFILGHIKIWQADQYGQPDAIPVVTDTDVYYMNDTYQQFIREGEYMVTYDLYEEDGTTLKGHYKNKTNLVVGPGTQSSSSASDEETSTTLINLLNREQI